MKTDRSLSSVVKDIRFHYKQNPNHGAGCSCIDAYIKELRQQMPDDLASDPVERKVKSTVSSILYSLMK